MLFYADHYKFFFTLVPHIKGEIDIDPNIMLQLYQMVYADLEPDYSYSKYDISRFTCKSTYIRYIVSGCVIAVDFSRL